MHSLQIKGTQINDTKTWRLPGPVTALKMSPDCETLLLSSDTVSPQMHHTKNNMLLEIQVI